MKYLKEFQTHSQYEAYTADTSNFILPNVSKCIQQDDIHYNPYVPPQPLVAKFNITDTSSPTKIGYGSYISGFSSIEIDGVAQPSVVSAYTFSTLGEHTIKYTLTDSTIVEWCAFYSCSAITSIIIPNGVTTISGASFGYCTSLTSVTMPDSITFIGQTSFANCTSLTSVTISDNVTVIGFAAFENCGSLISCTIGGGVTNLYRETFSNCINLTSITCNAMTAPTIQSSTFNAVKSGGTLYVPIGSSGYGAWMSKLSGWTKVEQ